MKTILISILASSMLATGLMAADVEAETKAPTEVHTGWYIGLGYGATTYNDGDMGKDFDNFSVEVNNDSDSGFKFYGGYKFNTIVGVEASYVQFGEFDFKSADATTNNVTTTIAPKSLNVAANLGYDFLNDQLRPYALAGLGYVNFDQSGSPEVYSTDNGGAFVWGIGVEYTPTVLQGVGFRLSMDSTCPIVIQSYDNADDKAYLTPLRLFSAGVQYKF